MLTLMMIFLSTGLQSVNLGAKLIIGQHGGGPFMHTMITFIEKNL